LSPTQRGLERQQGRRAADVCERETDTLTHTHKDSRISRRKRETHELTLFRETHELTLFLSRTREATGERG